MRKYSILIAILVVLAFSFGSLAVQNGYDLFQKALAKERAEGNLEEAITLYQKVIEESKDESLSAKAQLRIGICYEKLGKKEAEKAFRNVINNYPGQVEVVKAARKKLSFLLKAQATAGNKKEFKLSKIYSGGDYIDSISPDGQKLALIRGNEIWVRDIATGKEVELTTEKKLNSKILWSPDSKMIAFVDSERNIKVVSIKNGAPRTLVSSDQIEKEEDIIPTSWSADGKKVIFHVPSKGLFAVSSTGGNRDEILTFEDPEEAKKHQSMVMSPDGRWIAYTAFHKGNADIFVMPSKGGKSIRLTSNPARDIRPFWSYDSKRLAFYSYREGNPQIWVIGISSEGKPNGSPFQVTRETHVLGGNWTQDGRIGFPAAFRIQQIFIANPDGSEETQLTRFPCGNYEPRWSPEGNKIAFISDYLQSLNNFRLWMIPSEGGEAKLIIDQRVGEYIWTEDGKKILFSTEKSPNTSVLMSVPAEEGEPEEISTIHGEIGSLHLSHDGESILYTYSIRPSQYTDVAEYIEKRLSGVGIISVDDGKSKTLIPADQKGLWYSCARWSPDGQKIAYIIFDEELYKKDKTYSIWTMDVNKKEPKMITKGGEYVLGWSPDGKEIIFEKRIKGMDFELYKVRLDEGKPAKLNIRGRSPEFSPDGNKIAYTRWIKGGYQFWIVENIHK